MAYFSFAQQEERSGHSKHRFHFHRNSSSSTKRLSTNIADTNVYIIEEPEVYQLSSPKSQPKGKISTPDSPLLTPSSQKPKPPALPPPGTSCGDSGGSTEDLKEGEPPPLPPRSTTVTEDIPMVHVVVPASASVGTGSMPEHKKPKLSSEVITVQATVEEGAEVESTPPLNYDVVTEMEPHSSANESGDHGERNIHDYEGSHDAPSDCTVSTKLKSGERQEGGVRQPSPEN